MDDQELKYWVGFSRLPGIGRARIALLEQTYGSLADAWSAPADALEKVLSLERRSRDALQRRKATIDLDRELDQLGKVGVKLITWHDDHYPRLLRETYDLPPLLYVRGTLTREDETALAVVGTRKATAYGREATHTIVTGLVHSGVTIVSGLARGVDAAAHRAALEAGGRTLAIMASGLDTVYPPEHLNLAQEIMKHGALISEHPLGTRPEASHFPRRNRIMSGLSLGVLIVEAGEESGAHITIRYALEYDREVFAVPGSIFSPGSKGTHRWIQEGAKLVTRAEDILEELNVTTLGQQLELKATVATTPAESLLLQHLSHEPVHIDDVGRRCGLPMPEVSSALAMLELKGAVRQVGVMSFVRA